MEYRVFNNDHLSSSFMVIVSPLEWEEARQACKKLGFQIARLFSDHELSYVKNIIDLLADVSGKAKSYK